MKHYSFTNIRFFLLTVCLGFLNLTGFSQESTNAQNLLANFQISGSIDSYFHTNFNGLNKYVNDENGEEIAVPQAPATSFVNDPGFSIGFANVILGYEDNKVGFVADLVFGPRGEDAVFLSGPANNIVNQLYAFYKVTDNIMFTLGNFNTYLGYEVISPAVNFNYSTSYMFSYGPFSHTGLKADFIFSENWTGMLALMNPTDWTEFNYSGLYSYGGQLGYSTGAGGVFLNLLYGEQNRDANATFQVDLTSGWNVYTNFYLGFNSTYQVTNGTGFYGAAVYPQFKTAENFSLGLRAEYFKELEGGGVAYGANTSTLDFTLTGNYTVGNLTIKPEIRLDKVSEKVFLDRELQPINTLSSFVLAAVYAF